MKKIYISGKITNNANYKADFEAAGLVLKIAGFQPVNPAEVAAFRRCKKAAQEKKTVSAFIFEKTGIIK